MEKPSALRRRRLYLGLTLDRLAFAIGVTTAHISLVERGLMRQPRALQVENKIIAYLSAQERLARRDKAVAR